MVHSCFILPTPLPSGGAGLGNRATQLWHKTVGFVSFPFSTCRSPPALRRGRLGVKIGYTYGGTKLCDSLCSLVR